VARRHRRKALEHIAIAFPDWPHARRRQVIHDMFRHLGMSLFEIVWLPKLDARSLARTTAFEGFEAAAEIVRGGRPVILFTAHCGNWEWLAAAIAHAGAPLTALQRERDEGGLSDFILDIRAAAGIKTIDRGSPGAGRDLIHALRRGTFLGFLIDQSIRVESVNVPFFGRPAPTAIGPARMAIRAGAHAVHMFIERRADGTHLVRCSEPVELRRNDDPVALTALMTRAIEEQIRRVPEQWVWMHERWRERPKWLIGAEPAR
jgi:KDO2-lipid IV(A) lauroyltransferase